ncbi:type I restriction endonuclease subunit R [Leptospira levettii]|uniref:DEAD/DEAH box helicase family protein n=1 Tax=Leptospira levettii TaxID=2023178 RepID=UPI0010827299|nr:DEAD/DEAH box helicase family protein [Leptospira levettii]TGL13093.1 type I restriction endonuclease subunit R [Leptospira levettii]
MKSDKEKIFENHIAAYLTEKHRYTQLSAADCTDTDFHFIAAHLLDFIKDTQLSKYGKLQENYGTDTDREILEALKTELERKPLWVIMRNSLPVRGIAFDLYYPKPRSSNSQTSFDNYNKNKFSLKQQYHFSSDTSQSIDLVLFLNGLPIITIELKHEDEGQNVYDAVEQYNTRPQENQIFTLPFLHIAADTSEVKIATNPFSEHNFIPFNQGLTNKEENQGEYPIEFLYKDVLSKDWVLEYISFFLLYIPPNQKITDDGILLVEPERTIFPRYHQLRSNHKLAQSISSHFEAENTLGLKYLINHSAGSGKTLTISWLTDRLDSLYSESNQKIFDMVIVLTDRKSLDKNIKDELANFVHLNNKIGLAKDSDKLKNFIRQRKSIVVSTIQKFSYIQEIIQEDEGLKQLRIAFIIDEAHRSQDGKMASNVKAIFTNPEQPDNEELPTDEDEIIYEAKKVNITNQVLIAFTATPIQTTVDYFGQPLDEYTEDEAIKEGYILDVANNIISYQTLYHLKSKTIIPDDEMYPAGVVHKALREVAFRDPELIQYKSEVILKYFEDKVKDTLNGRGKAMVVTSSRAAGLLYFEALKEKIAKRNLPYKVLFAFSDFTDEKGNEIKEETLNELTTTHAGKKIEDVFDENDDYRIIVVANKFQTGFNQPKLVSMFLDKPVRGVNAVQTLSRLNRKTYGKDTTMVVDFTNSVQSIFDAFRRYRSGSRFEPQEPNPQALEDRYNEFLSFNIFDENEIIHYTELIKQATTDHAKDADLMTLSNDYRNKFRELIPEKEAQKDIVNFLNRFVSDFYFTTLFFQLTIKIIRFALFAEVIADKLYKKGSASSLKDHLKNLLVEKSTVRYRGVIISTTVNEPPPPPRGGTVRGRTDPPRASIPDVMVDLRNVFQITDGEALLINQVIESILNDRNVLDLIFNNSKNKWFLDNYKQNLKQRVIDFYLSKNWDQRLIEGPYISPGGIIDYIVNAAYRLILYKGD